MEKVKIIGLGNILLSDEGIGIHVINHLRSWQQFQNIEFLDLGTSSYEIVNHIDYTVKKLIIIDCVNTSLEPPGSIKKLTIKDLKPNSNIRFSLHQIELIDSIKLISIETSFPETMIVGIVPYDIRTYSTNLSHTLNGMFQRILKSVGEIISDFIND